ncbi:MAG TPA: hypothetical protein VD791_08840 [Burkholderiales bacterium]|nr:hypothetical protein [Burkholderiales bacterium]
MMRRLALVALAAAACLPAASRAQAADGWYGRLFYTPAQRAALEDARRRKVRTEELAVETAKRPPAPRSRKVTLTGIVQRSDGESFAWVNGKPVEGRTRDGLRVRHSAGPGEVVVYDPQKGRTVSVKVGQRVDLLTGRIEEAYERNRAVPAQTVQDAAGSVPAPAPEPPRNARSETEVEDEEQVDEDEADSKG